MRINELQQENTMPHLYLDMDGVQADLFPEVARRCGVKHWDDIPDQDKAFTEISMQGPETAYQLFRVLKPLPGGQRIVKWLHENKIPFTVLSAPLRNQGEASVKAKKDWLDEYNPGTSQSAIFTKRKFKYAVTDGVHNVLVDDFNYYLQTWADAGGIAVKHSDASTDHTIQQLEKIYQPYLGK